MTSNGHNRLVGSQWIRKYPCTYCHTTTVASSTPIPGKPPVDGAVITGRYSSGIFVTGKHVNGARDVKVNDFWRIEGSRKTYPLPSYNTATTNCENLYCHSDGTTDPDPTRDLYWRKIGPPQSTSCNSCHGHAQGECGICHNGVTQVNGKILSVRTGWPAGEEWKSAMPMFSNEGANAPRSNSHPRHMETSFSCDECHSQTITNGGDCATCHQGTITGSMRENSHLNAAFHVNKVRDVSFKQGGTYNYLSTTIKSCSNTTCHTGDDPVWGASVNNEIICLSCHGAPSSADVDDFGSYNGLKAKINLVEWKDSGHGRTTAKGNYKSGNPPANFPGNPCWYCHDNNVLHKDGTNPYRLRIHAQFNNRYERECVYCHMQRDDRECLNCHNNVETLAPQLSAIFANATAKWPDGTHVVRPNHSGYNPLSNPQDSCVQATCHAIPAGNLVNDLKIHNVGAGFWNMTTKADVKNQYLMMGVCLQCHDDDSNGKCNGCHDSSNPKYRLGFDPGTGFIKPAKARASSVHFGHKHYRGFLATGGWEKDTNGQVKGIWKGGKFCWDCHDPHGDDNIYMIQGQVATVTDGTFGIPKQRARVRFTQKNSGDDYVKSTGTIDGLCNVCHTSGSQHYRSDGGDGHNSSYVCTKCHEHRFTDSHGGAGNSCTTCHRNKPVPRHSGFGLPRDCTKCHAGNVGGRVDIMGQFRGNSHHVQGVAVTNQHCYACHWEATPEGLIDIRYHEGYNYKNYSTVKNAKVDLVVWGPGVRPNAYREYSSAAGRATAAQFLASRINSTNVAVERRESAKLTNVCLSCHSDQNNDATPFGDCKTPRQYAWDRQSVAARYAQKGTAKWGKYSTATTSGKSKITKAFSAHGNAAANQGGWDPNTGVDATIANTRAGFANLSSNLHTVQCFDCHNSHGSKVAGVTSSYVNFSGSRNGGNLKEVTAGKGGYSMTYFARAKAKGSGVVNPYNAGAGQCFDCHMTASKGTTPWGYNSTFGATQPIKGYRDGLRFGQRTTATYRLASPVKANKPVVGGHFQASSPLDPARPVMGTIDGLCTPCHDPHGVSPSLGDNKAYAIPLLKDTWLTSPYKEDKPPRDPYGTNSTPTTWGTPLYNGWLKPTVAPVSTYYTDRTTFGTGRITEPEEQFAGLCLKCHPKKSLLGNYTGAVNTPTNASKAPWKSVARVHAAVKDWGKNKVSGEHANPCSKCHQPHNSSLPRLMQTNCLDYWHRGNRPTGGQVYSAYNMPTGGHGRTEFRGFPAANVLGNTAAADPTIACHAGAEKNTAPGYPDVKWPDKQYWNNVTPWPQPR
jgi:predicted CxxxxCH...CXXCH cytochrome family protein